MKIKVEENLFIESDGVQFILRDYSGKVDKKGKEIYKSLGFFGSLQSALKKVVKIKIMKSNAETIQQLLSELKIIEDEIDDLINNII